MSWLIAWLILLAILIIIELFTLQFTTICFGCGAGCAAILAVLGAPEWTQCVAFAIISFVMFAFVRPVAKRRMKKRMQRDKVNSLIGKRGRVISEIDNWHGVGRVEVLGQVWSAVSEEENVIIPSGAIINVTDVYNDKLVICLDEVMHGNIELKMSEAVLDPDYRNDDDWQ